MYSQLLVDAPVTHHHWSRMMSVVTVQVHGVFSPLYLNEMILEGVTGDSSPENHLDVKLFLFLLFLWLVPLAACRRICKPVHITSFRCLHPVFHWNLIQFFRSCAKIHVHLSDSLIEPDSWFAEIFQKPKRLNLYYFLSPWSLLQVFSFTVH